MKLEKFDKILCTFDLLNEIEQFEYSEFELLNFATKIVEISNKEYSDDLTREYNQNPNYYSKEIDNSFRDIQFSILAREDKNLNPDFYDECLDRSLRKLKDLTSLSII